MKIFLTLIFLVLANMSWAQMRIDQTVSFQTDPAKQYSIYIPSGYSQGTPSKMMLALHPLNPARWNSISWCDTLIAFAEANNLLMICPDGGADGAVDDPIDTAFTSFILDSMLIWYAVDVEKIYAMGFSVGGRTTYSYGLNHISRFGGFIPIGAAINGLDGLDNLLPLTDSIPFYLVHGSNDAPNTRFYPMRDSLIENGAFVNSLLMPGVGHTIDFPNRNQILTDAFVWVDSVNCANKAIPPDTTTGISVVKEYNNQFSIAGANSFNDLITIAYTGEKTQIIEYTIVSLSGKRIQSGKMTCSPASAVQSIQMTDFNSTGIHFIRFELQDRIEVLKILLGN